MYNIFLKCFVLHVVSVIIHYYLRQQRICLSICLSVCLLVNSLTQKVMNGFSSNFYLSTLMFLSNKNIFYMFLLKSLNVAKSLNLHLGSNKNTLKTTFLVIS